MKRIQQLHLWLGTLFAPLIIFFSLSGALQTLGWHELEKGGQKTPAWIAQLAAVHKHQTVQSGEGGPRRRPPGGASSANAPRREGASQGQGARGPSPWPLKIVVVLMSLGLIFTTALGIWMAFKYSSKKKSVVWALLIVGTVLPIALLWI